MATPGPGQLTSQAWQKLTNDGKPEDNIFLEYSQLKRLEEAKAFRPFTGGRSLIGTIEYAINSTVASITPTQTIDTAIVDVFDEWEANWKQYAGTFSMTSFEEAVNRGDSAKFNLEKGKLKNLRSSMRKMINAHIFGATASSTDLSGLQSLVPDSPATGTVETINAGTFTFWRSKQTSGAQTTSAFDNLRSSMRTIRTSCSSGQGVSFPTYYVTGSATANGYESLLIANERIADKSDKAANGAFSGNVYYFGDAKLYWDVDCSDTRMYALNYENLQMAYQSGYWFKGYPAVNPANQLLDVFKAETQCQLITNNRRHLGVITAIS
jgi:hypothetical protein